MTGTVEVRQVRSGLEQTGTEGIGRERYSRRDEE